MDITDAFKIMKNELELKKLRNTPPSPPHPPQVKGVKNSKKHYKGQFPNTQKIPYMFFFYLEFKDDL
jgi:hypothetical protein